MRLLKIINNNRRKKNRPKKKTDSDDEEKLELSPVLRPPVHRTPAACKLLRLSAARRWIKFLHARWAAPRILTRRLSRYRCKRKYRLAKKQIRGRVIAAAHKHSVSSDLEGIFSLYTNSTDKVQTPTARNSGILAPYEEQSKKPASRPTKTEAARQKATVLKFLRGGKRYRENLRKNFIRSRGYPVYASKVIKLKLARERYRRRRKEKAVRKRLKRLSAQRDAKLVHAVVIRRRPPEHITHICSKNTKIQSKRKSHHLLESEKLRKNQEARALALRAVLGHK